MNESAQENDTPSQPPSEGPDLDRQQLEFCSKMLQHLPSGLTPEFRQHLVDNKEEFRARLAKFGLTADRNLRYQMFPEREQELWMEFYAEMLHISPDFSRIYFGRESDIFYTYTQSIPVASQGQATIRELVAVIAKLGISVVIDSFSSLDRLTDLTGRSIRNYIIAISPDIYEEVPKKIHNLDEYGVKHLTLREYLLCLACSQYHLKRTSYTEFGKRLAKVCTGSYLVIMKKITEKGQVRTGVILRYDGEELSIYDVGNLETSWQSALSSLKWEHLPQGIRSVKFYESLKRVE